MADQSKTPGVGGQKQGTSGAAGGAGDPEGAAPDQMTIERLKEDVARLREDLGALLRSGWSDARHRVDSRVHAARDATREAVDMAKERGGQALHAVRDTVEDKPLAAVLIAFGAGMLAAKLLDRR